MNFLLDEESTVSLLAVATGVATWYAAVVWLVVITVVGSVRSFRWCVRRIRR